MIQTIFFLEILMNYETNSFLFKFHQILIAHLCKILQIVFIQNDFQNVIYVENVIHVHNVKTVMDVNLVFNVTLVVIVLIVTIVKIVNIVYQVKIYNIKCL